MLLTGILAPPFIATVIFFDQDYLIALRDYDKMQFALAYPVMAVTTVAFGLATAATRIRRREAMSTCIDCAVSGGVAKGS